MSTVGVVRETPRGFDLLRIPAVRRLVSWSGSPYVFQAAGLLAFLALLVGGWGQHTPAGVNAKLVAKTNLVTLLVWGISTAAATSSSAASASRPAVPTTCACCSAGRSRSRTPARRAQAGRPRSS